MEIKSNTILITGGASGIGLAFAKAFRDLGNTVIICGRNEEKLHQVVKECPDIKSIKCDISAADDVTSLFNKIKDNYPDFNMLINNAGIFNSYDLLDGHDHGKEIAQEIDIDLTAQIKLTNIFLPLLKSQPNASIVNVTSALARVIINNASVYCSAKAGFSMFTRAIRKQLKSTNIRVFEVIPPLVNTEMNKGGKGAISPEQLVQESIAAFKRDLYEIRVGKTKLFFFLNQICPFLAEKLIGRV